MKIPLSLLLLVAIHYCIAQTNSELYKQQILTNKNLIDKDIKDEFIKNDVSQILTKTPSQSIYGFIGGTYQRMRIKFISVIRNKENPSQYFVYGKSMVKENVCEFQGLVTITNVFDFKNPEFPDYRTGKLLGDYIFYENLSQQHVGIFRGVFCSNWYFDKTGALHYDDLMSEADGFSNNGFVGTWTNYSGTLIKQCSWGDWRIPISGDLDIGVGEFIPDQKYVRNGWSNLRLAYGVQTDKITEEAKKTEQAEWWK
jgi:hypothetical protein